MAMRIPPRLQGDIGEFSALGWLVLQGAKVYLPYGHSPDVDLVADFGDRILRVQVKTSNVFRNRRFDVTICTRGGNQSWNGITKHFDPLRCDYLFAHVGDGRRWFIPAAAVDGTSCVRLGGPKYEPYEIDRDRPLEELARRRLGTLADPLAGFPSGQRGCAVNALALPSQVRILPPP
jgi:PD-(D/E)XK endonuclease